MVSICPLSKYKDIFGKPRTGIHKYRFFDVAIIDVIGTIIMACIITYITEIPLLMTTGFLLKLGLFLHIIFGVKTNTIKYLGILNNNNN